MSLSLETLQQSRSNIGVVNFTNFLRSLSSEPDEYIYQVRYTVFKILQNGVSRSETPAPVVARRTGSDKSIVETRVGVKRTMTINESRILSPEVVIASAVNIGSLTFLSYGLRSLNSTPGVSNDRAKQLTNSYINIPDKGAQHILAYLYENWPDQNSLPTAAALLLLRGADITSPAFRSPDKLTQKMSTIAIPTVEEIIRRNVDEKEIQLPINLRMNLVDFPPREALSEFFSPTEIDTIAVYLDDPSIISLETNLTELFNLMVEMQSHRVLDQAYKLFQPTDTSFLAFIVRVINPYAYRSTIQNNIIGPDYFLLNEIIIRASRSHTNGLIAITEAYSDMLVDSINAGYELDQYQIRMIELHLPSTQYQRILDSMSKPIWKKVCSNKRGSNEKVTDIRILELARSLGVDITQTKDYVCGQLESMSDVDPRKLVIRAINNEKKKFLLETQGTDLGKFTPLSPEALNNAHCDNKNFKFDHTGTVYFHDSTGNWCLTPDNFSTAILNKTNPYNTLSLSEKVFDDINSRLDVLRKLDLPEKPLTFEEAVNRLGGVKITNVNQVNSDLTQNAITTFESTAGNYGVRNPREILRKKDDPILFLMESTNYLDPDNVFGVMLDGLTVEHAYATLSRLANEVFLQQPELPTSFFREFFST